MSLAADDTYAVPDLSIVHHESEAKALVELLPLEDLTKAECRLLVQQSLQHLWWDVAGSLIEACRNRDVSSVVYKMSSNINSKLKDMKNLLRKRSKISISPAFQWAQNSSNILVSVKLAHKMDTPATLGCNVTAADFSTKVGESSLKFKADCKKSRKSFLLMLNLFDTIKPEMSSWEWGSVGRLTFNMVKNVSKPWIRLIKSKKKPGNMHVWWDMKNKFEAEEKKAKDEVKRKQQAADKAVKDEEKKRKDKEKAAEDKEKAAEDALQQKEAKEDYVARNLQEEAITAETGTGGDRNNAPDEEHSSTDGDTMVTTEASTEKQEL